MAARAATNKDSKTKDDPAIERKAGASETTRSAIPVAPNLSADASLSPKIDEKDERKILLADIERIRQIRKPFGGATQKLALPKRNGYHRHWFNDVAGRIDEAEASGWSHIKGRDGKPIRRSVGTGRDNGVLYAFAMELPETFWQEDMDARHAEAQARMDAIKKSPARSKPGQANQSDTGKFYNPVEETGAPPVSITRG